MKRFTTAAVFALALGAADTASAQVVYGYNTVNPYNGTVVQNRTVMTPWVAQQQQSYYNPYFGYGGTNMQYRNAWGTGYSQGYGFNPYGGGYNYNLYRPGFGNPYVTGYRYRW